MTLKLDTIERGNWDLFLVGKKERERGKKSPASSSQRCRETAFGAYKWQKTGWVERRGSGGRAILWEGKPNVGEPGTFQEKVEKQEKKELFSAKHRIGKLWFSGVSSERRNSGATNSVEEGQTPEVKGGQEKYITKDFYVLDIGGKNTDTRENVFNRRTEQCHAELKNEWVKTLAKKRGAKRMPLFLEKILGGSVTRQRLILGIERNKCFLAKRNLGKRRGSKEGYGCTSLKRFKNSEEGKERKK